MSKRDVSTKQFVRRDSLVTQASLDRETNEDRRRQSVIRNREELERKYLVGKEVIIPFEYPLISAYYLTLKMDQMFRF